MEEAEGKQTGSDGVGDGKGRRRVSQPVPPDKEVGPREPDLAQLLGWALSHQVSDSN